ncbi:hypothetical protein AB0L41_25380 [Amycolatopsis mediterranei]|uniref:hypothetical protein n=1 Tax=Amycolatopsis mediterranei TaxID=33910 RepID=UPI0034123B72
MSGWFSAASSQSIAKAAGVGQGALSRRFPRREAPLVAVYRHELADAAPALLGEHGPGKAAGALREDVDAEDVLQLVGFLWRTGFGADRDGLKA